MRMPAMRMASILSSAPPLPPAMIAPAWPMRLPGGATAPIAELPLWELLNVTNEDIIEATAAKADQFKPPDQETEYSDINYNILGVKRNASEKEIKSAFRNCPRATELVTAIQRMPARLAASTPAGASSKRRPSDVWSDAYRHWLKGQDCLLSGAQSTKGPTDWHSP
jgi:hypothetical protein